MNEQDCIYALSSGHGRAGIAVIRVSGAGACAALEALVDGPPAPRRASLRKVRHPNTRDVLDEALVLWFPAPNSFTGEDLFELHIHGGLACTAGVLEALGCLSGLRPAEAGEFTRRAFHNGRLDLTQVEGLADLINAETEGQRRQALRQMDGYLGERCTQWRDELVHCLAYFEAEIDFPDEQDVPAHMADALLERLTALSGCIQKEIASAPMGERLREGLRVVIAGAPNVGKSSLLNLLAKRDAAIVSAEAGTTRDVIEVHMDLGGYPVVLVDTAGMRETTNTIEQEGVARAMRNVESADLVVWMHDAKEPAGKTGLPADLSASVVHVLNKCDLGKPAEAGLSESRGAIPISAKTGEGIDTFVEALHAQTGEIFGGGASALVTRERHRLALQDCCNAIGGAVTAINAGSGAELVAEELRRAVRALARVTGAVDVEDLLDVIFRDFCIGK